jgi:hypothetical protein
VGGALTPLRDPGGALLMPNLLTCTWADDQACTAIQERAETCLPFFASSLRFARPRLPVPLKTSAFLISSKPFSLSPESIEAEARREGGREAMSIE